VNGESNFPIVRLERTLPAPPRSVYRAWLEPEMVRRWLTPGLSVGRVEIDARVGGRFRVWHQDGQTPAGGFDCEIVELVPFERIVYRWGFVGPKFGGTEPDPGPRFDSRLSLALRPTSDGRETVLTLVHERLDELAAALPHVAKNVEKGWAIVLGHLQGELERMHEA
jgi:uncharacterized protein YndB with AHSA1/START domain